MRALLVTFGVTALVAAGGLAAVRPDARPLPGLPAYTAGYASWPKLNRKPIAPRTAGDAHLGRKNVYTSKRRAPGATRFPAGTVIVKAANRPGQSFIGLIAVMRKLRGFDRRNNDWQMIEYVRNSADARFTELARGQICYSCHVGARARDYVFTRG